MSAGPYVVVGVALGALSALLYALSLLGQGGKPDLGNAVGLFVSWLGVTTGVRVCVVSFVADNLGVFTTAIDRAYIFLVGCVLIWVGLGGVGRAFGQLAEQRQDAEQAEQAERTGEAVEDAARTVDEVRREREDGDG